MTSHPSSGPERRPNPGSEEARARGCTCPVIDNHHGRGFPRLGVTCFYVVDTCPVHRAQAQYGGGGV